MAESRGRERGVLVRESERKMNIILEAPTLSLGGRGYLYIIHKRPMWAIE
jgi:hypothetical protein